MFCEFILFDGVQMINRLNMTSYKYLKVMLQILGYNRKENRVQLSIYIRVSLVAIGL